MSAKGRKALEGENELLFNHNKMLQGQVASLWNDMNKLVSLPLETGIEYLMKIREEYKQLKENKNEVD